ncbi:Modifier of rudimentary, Modr [Metarhizium brunneum]
MSSFTPELHSSTPPAPPPKGGSHDVSSISTPTTSSSPPPAPFLPRPLPNDGQIVSATSTPPPLTVSEPIPDPGDGWLPEILRDKSTQDLADILANPVLLNALAHAPTSSHDSTKTSHANLSAALDQNTQLAKQLRSAEARLAHQRSTTQAQLLATHALERQWRQKQSDMDHALAPFSPASLYQQLAQGVQEQALVCQAMEESFLEGGGAGVDGVPASERELTEWIRRYREAKVLCYLRQERKERWDEGRVGGWR